MNEMVSDIFVVFHKLWMIFVDVMIDCRSYYDHIEGLENMEVFPLRMSLAP